MIIDWQHHFAPKDIYEKHQGKSKTPVYQNGKVVAHAQPFMHQVEKHLEFMDTVGIDVAVVSTTTVTDLEDCKSISNAYAKLMNEYPTRFVGLALCVPTQGDSALRELDRAINELGLRGVVIRPQIEGTPLDSERLYPFYEMVAEFRVPIFVHVTRAPNGYEALEANYNLNVTLTREFDIANAVYRIILGGILAKFPDLKFAFAHMGGGISALKERMVSYLDVWGERVWTEMGGTPPFGKPFAENFNRYFDKIYFDMAGFEGGMNAVKCALTTISPSNLLFGTDFPHNFTNDFKAARNYIENIRKLDLSSESLEAMFGLNAAGLLGLEQ